MFGGEHGAAAAAYAVCAEGDEPAGMCRLPLPVPSAFQWFVPYLDSGDLDLEVRALGRDFNALSYNDAAGCLATRSSWALTLP